MRILFKLLAAASLGFMCNSYGLADGAHQYCLEQEGNLVKLSQIDKNQRLTGVEKIFCVLHYHDEGEKFVDLETFASDYLTMAVHAFREPQQRNNTTSVANSPAYRYCVEHLRGMYSNWVDLKTGNESGTCGFADGSVMSDWALDMGAERLPLLNKSFRYQK